MKKILLLAFMLSAVNLMAQQIITFKGKVTNAKKEALSGVTISFLPAGKNCTSNETGEYSYKLQSVEGKVTVRVSTVGYSTEEKVLEDIQSVNELNFELKSDVLSLNDVVLVGNANGKSKLNSSVSVSSLKMDEVQKAAPRTTAEIFRSIPGIKCEASGGDGNTNITVRGVPISAGGSKYLQLQEDGLPVLQFGDIAFATSDIFLRADNTLSRIEAIRGGSASVMATNSPAGIINFVSKTGQTEGGSIAVSSGVDYNNFRSDFNYGAPIGNGVTFNVGGFYRVGEGPRDAGFNANNGGQVKLNLTKNFGKGFVRFYFKYLNDRAAAYMSTPFSVTGTNADPTYSGLDGFDPMHGSLYSPFMQQNYGLGGNNEKRKADVSDGMHPVSTSYGAEFNVDLGNSWKLEDRTRMSINNGRFIAPFPASVGTTSDMVGAVGSATGWNLAGSSLKYANDGTAFNGKYAMIIHMFDVDLNNFNNFVNDLKISKKFKGGDVTFGYYKSIQNINMSWLWNSYLTDVKSSGLRPLDIYSSSSQKMTQNGLFAYGVPVWGNCCQRSYDVVYDISAPYANVNLEANEKLNFELGVRWDNGRVNGTYAGNAQSSVDVNNDGTIQPTEVSVSSINHAAASVVNYKYNYLSYSLGSNYKLSSSSALFARYSTGYSAKADRILFTPNVFADGSSKGVTDQIDQFELGYKSNMKNLGLFITAFYANVNEAGGYEATTQRIIENHYKSFGIEIEAAARLSKSLEIHGGITYTKAEITDGANKGNLPRRQAPFIFNLMPTYTAGNFSAGFSAIGTSSSYAQDDNQLKFNGYVLINPFVSYKFSKLIYMSLNGNNIFNTLGITESEEGSIKDNATNNIVRARSVTGRTVSATIGFNF